MYIKCSIINYNRSQILYKNTFVSVTQNSFVSTNYLRAINSLNLTTFMIFCAKQNY